MVYNIGIGEALGQAGFGGFHIMKWYNWLLVSVVWFSLCVWALDILAL